MYQGQHSTIMAALRANAEAASGVAEPEVVIPPAYLLTVKERQRLRFIKWLLEEGRISV
jgi:hypothetical protein